MAATNGQKTALEFSLVAGNARFDFSFMEIPSELVGLGGKKLAALIQLEGGTRVIQTFGNVPHDAISWHGMIFGPDSFSRWGQLDGFRTSGQTVTLTYGQFKWTGILEETELLPGFEGYLPYRARFLPQADQSAVNVTQTPPQSIDQSAAASASAAAAAAAVAQASSTPQVVLLGTQAAVAAQTAQQAIGTSLTTALAVNSGSVGTASGLVSAAATATFAMFSTASVIDVSATLLPLWVALTELANVLGQTPQSPQVTVLADGRLTNLYLLATRYFGDPDEWTTISLANGGIPAFWAGQLSVIIPNVPT